MGSLLENHNVGALLLALVIGGGLSAGPRGAAGFRRDEIECEETYAKLADCCAAPQLSRVSCEFHQGCEYSEEPDLTPQESRCIRELSCSAIRAATICERLAQRAESPDPVGAAVCP